MFPFEVIPFSTDTPERNMEKDISLAREALKQNKFLLRWYGWKKLSLSFGYSQKKLFETYKGTIPKVIRPTGGGILIHGWDISFAFATPRGTFKSHLELYRFVSEIFVASLRNLGVNATYSRNKKGNYSRTGLCQLFPTFGEVLVNGRKFLAAAVRDFGRGNYLIHGSVYIAYNHRLAENLLKTPSEVLKNSVITLLEIGLKKKTLFEETTKNFKKHLKDKFHLHTF
jgi:lipoate-protein ligase A